MRTLKKSLSLVLVLAMVFSFCAFGTSAAYVDADKIDAEYTADVEMLSTLGILKGDDAGFRPDDTLTRAEAAVIIVKMLGADKLAKTAVCTFDDVQVGDWFYPWIGYCQGIGLMKGYGDGTVGPNDKLTAHQFALMVMKAAKVDTKTVDPAAFELTVAALAVKEGFATVEELTAASFTREMAASVAFEGLRYDPAGYIYVVTHGGIDYEFTNANDAAIFAATVNAGAPVPQAAGTSLLTAKFGITENLAAKDVFGRPGVSYSKTGWVAPIFFADEPVLTYTNTAVTGGKIYTDLGKPATATITAPIGGAGYIFVDGAENALTDNELVSDTYALTISSGNLDYVGGKGSVVEVYKVGTTSYRIVVVNTYADTIATHSAAVLDANGDIVTKEKVTLTGAALPFNTTDFTDLDAALHTVVYYTKAAGTLMSVTAAESFEGTLTKYDATLGTYVIDGETYKLNGNVAGLAATVQGAFNTKTVYYVDNSGLIIGTDSVYVARNLAIVTELVLVQPTSDGSIGSSATPYMQAELVFADGSKQVVTVAGVISDADPAVTYTVAGANGATAVTAGNIATVKALVNGEIAGYQVNGLGQYVLTALNQDDSAATANLVASSSYAKNNADPAVAIAGLIANNNTKFVVRTGAGSPVDPYVYTTYTGYSNLPTKLFNANTATIKGVHAVGSTIAELVYITGTDATTSSDVTVAYVYGTAGKVLDNAATGAFHYEYAAVVNGENVTLKVASSCTNAGSLSGFYTIASVQTATGYVASTTTPGTDTIATGTIAKDGVVQFTTAGAKDYNGSEKVIVIDPITGAVSTGSIEALTSVNTSAVYVVYAKDVLGNTTNVVASIIAIKAVA